jgi:hypothetical protein
VRLHFQLVTHLSAELAISWTSMRCKALHAQDKPFVGHQTDILVIADHRSMVAIDHRFLHHHERLPGRKHPHFSRRGGRPDPQPRLRDRLPSRLLFLRRRQLLEVKICPGPRDNRHKGTVQLSAF